MYNCNLIRVVDGDTLILDINLGIPIEGLNRDLAMGLAARDGSIWVVKERVRLVKVNAPEMKDSQGQVSKDYLISLCRDAPLQIITFKRERYGRMLGNVFNSRGESLSDLLLQAHQAALYRQAD